MDEKEFDSINVIPLVDIMLVLLTIVLTTSALVATGTLPVQLPQATAEKETLLRMQTIEIDNAGIIYLNKQRVCVSELDASLTGMNTGWPVLIRADRTLALQAFVDVLDVVKKHGFTRVSLQTEGK